MWKKGVDAQDRADLVELRVSLKRRRQSVFIGKGSTASPSINDRMHAPRVDV
jgi:hypothetical protein